MAEIKLSLDIRNVIPFIDSLELRTIEHKAKQAHDQLLKGTGKGADFVGWFSLPSDISSTLIQDILTQAEKIRKQSDIHVVIGIGGSYLGARAIIESLQHSFSNLGCGEVPKIVYAGHTLDEDYMVDLLTLLDNHDYTLSIISKSGTTTEPAVAFRLLRKHLEDKYGKEEARERITAITDSTKGVLKSIADTEGYKTYEIPDNVGGRFSVLTPVGLLPMAVAGINIEGLLKGARRMQFHAMQPNVADNIMWNYVTLRNALYQKGKSIELLVNYLPRLHYFGEWWKQLFGESEGKEGKGIFPATVNFTTDLHSMGQYIQEGQRILFETMICVQKPSQELKIPFVDGDADKLNFLAERRISDINHCAQEGTLMAHIEGDVPVFKIVLPELSDETMGELLYFFEYACGLSGYVLGVNPFDQPGVEAYKKNMFKLLGKPV